MVMTYDMMSGMDNKLIKCYTTARQFSVICLVGILYSFSFGLSSVISHMTRSQCCFSNQRQLETAGDNGTY